MYARNLNRDRQEGKTGDFIQTASRSVSQIRLYHEALAIIVLHLAYASVATQKKSPRASFSDFFARLFLSLSYHPPRRRNLPPCHDRLDQRATCIR